VYERDKVNVSLRRPISHFLTHLVVACCCALGCDADDDETGSPTGGTSGAAATTSGDASESTSSPDSGGAMEVDCSDAPSESIPVCLPRRDDGTCDETPDEVALCQGTCIETCCFEVEQVACGPDIAQTDRCCYWIVVGEMTCADTPEETCQPG
jgi:hypothetical protein